MGTSGINPKGLLFYVALIPQFVSADASLPVPVQSGLLGMTFVAMAGLVYTAVALLSRTLLQSRPGAARVVTLASGIIMVALGAVLLGEQLVPFLGRPLLVPAEFLPVLLPHPPHFLVLADGHRRPDFPLRFRVPAPAAPVARIQGPSA